MSIGPWEDELLELDELRDEEEQEWFTPPNQRLVCRCRAVPEHEIADLIREGADFETIVTRTGATTGCSGCRGPILSMIRAAQS